jgi:hypothetical protein
MAPEDVFRPLTCKSDVYRFGILLMEIVNGRSNQHILEQVCVNTINVLERFLCDLSSHWLKYYILKHDMTNFTFIMNQSVVCDTIHIHCININHILVHYGIFRPAFTEDYVLITDMETL